MSLIARMLRRFLYSLIYGSRLAPIDPALKNRVRGLFEAIDYRDGTLTLSGWMLLPRERLHSISVVVDKRHRCQAQMRDREDLAAAFPFIAHARHGGFTVSLPLDLDRGARVDISVEAGLDGAGGRQHGRLVFALRAFQDSAFRPDEACDGI